MIISQDLREEYFSKLALSDHYKSATHFNHESSNQHLIEEQYGVEKGQSSSIKSM